MCTYLCDSDQVRERPGRSLELPLGVCPGRVRLGSWATPAWVLGYHHWKQRSRWLQGQEAGEQLLAEAEAKLTLGFHRAHPAGHQPPLWTSLTQGRPASLQRTPPARPQTQGKVSRGEQEKLLQRSVFAGDRQVL